MRRAVLCKFQGMVCYTISSLVFGMDCAFLETDSGPSLVHCMRMWGDKCLGRAEVQLKLLDIFYKKKSPPTQILKTIHKILLSDNFKQ